MGVWTILRNWTALYTAAVTALLAWMDHIVDEMTKRTSVPSTMFNPNYTPLVTKKCRFQKTCSFSKTLEWKGTKIQGRSPELTFYFQWEPHHPAMLYSNMFQYGKKKWILYRTTNKHDTKAWVVTEHESYHQKEHFVVWNWQKLLTRLCAHGTKSWTDAWGYSVSQPRLSTL